MAAMEVKAVARSSEEAVESIDFNEIRCCFSRCQYAGGSGIELLKAIKRQSKKLPGDYANCGGR